MAVSRIPRIILDGDEESASYMAREGIRQLGILKNLMSFGNLQQDIRKVEYIDGSRIVCRSCFGEDVIHIYAEKDEWAERELIPRFFAFIAKEDEDTGAITTSYHWIYFNPDTVSLRDYRQTRNSNPVSISPGFEMYSWKAGDDVDCLRIMKNTPRGPDHLHKHPHRHTKSFMMDGRNRDVVDAAIAAGEELQEERYVSACHILTKNKETVFMPLHATETEFIPEEDRICDILDPTLYPIYPLPYPSSYYLAYASNILYTGLNFPCPPRRFYCNTEDGIMAWYTTNPTTVEAQDFICGVVYNIREQKLKTFIHYPADVQHMGYTPYWAIDIAAAEIPTPLMFDIQSLTPDEMNVAIAWSKRPINCKTNLRTAGRTYSELESCTHIRWIDTGTGFEAQLFVTWDQYKLEPTPDSDSDSFDIGDYDCSVHLTYLECAADDFHVVEWEAGKFWTETRTLDYHSSHVWDLLGNTLSIVADQDDLAENMYNYEHQTRCNWGAGVCDESHHNYAKSKTVESVLRQQKTDTFLCSWVCPNALDFNYKKNLVYCVGDAEVDIDSGIRAGYTPTRDDMNNRLDDWWSPFLDGIYHTVGDSFYHYMDMGGEDWFQIDTDILSSYAFGEGRRWTRSANVDTTSTTQLNKMQVDEDLEFLQSDVDHIYYLDDRATKDNQGLIAAGKGDSVTELYTDDCLGLVEYKPDFWKVYWKVTWDDSSTEYVDITDQLLELLDCTAGELLDIGLI